MLNRALMQFRRVPSLPPYVFAVTEQLKLELRRAGDDVIDLGFGNPDLPSPPAAVDKLTEAAAKPRNHRYSASRGIPKLRAAICDLYADRFGVELDPETQAVATIGAKEGLAHLMWVLVEPGDVAVVPTPSYPIHLQAPVLAGATVVAVELDGDDDELYDRFAAACSGSATPPRAIVVSFPHNPTTRVVDLALLERLVALAREHEALLVHDFAYADISFDGHRPPSVLQVPGAEDVAVEIYSLTKSFSMAGWRVGFALGNAPALAALARLKSYLDYGTFQPIQIASIVALNEAREYSAEVCEHLPQPPRRALQRPRPDRVAGRAAARDDVRLGADPGAVPRARARSSSRSSSSARHMSPSARVSGSGPAARATSASPSSRTSSGSDRPSGGSGTALPELAAPG